MKRLSKQLLLFAAIFLALGIFGIVGTIFAIIHAFNDIAVKGNASPAVVAVGVGEPILPLAIAFLCIIIAIVLGLIHALRSKRLRKASKR